MSVKAKRIILVVVVVAIVIGIFMIPKKKSSFPMKGGAEAETVYSVKTMTASRTSLQEYLSLNGNIQTANSIAVYPDISGKIVKVYVTLGSKVNRGDLIAEIDPSTPGSVYSVSGVYAPISGTITSLPLTNGTTVSTSSAIAQIGSVGVLQIKTNVVEKNVAALKNGLKADISLIAYDGEFFRAHVATVSPIVDETSRTKEVYLVFDDTDSRVNAGMYAKVKLYTIKHDNVIVIPYDAVSTIDGVSYAYIVKEDSTAEKREVKLGVNVDGNVEVEEGISEGEEVVISGIQSLEDGVKLRIVGGDK